MSCGTMKFVKKLLLAMENAKIKQDELGKVLELSQSRISQLARGEGRLYADQALKLSRILKVPMDYLIDEEIDSPPPSPELSEQEALILKIARELGYDEAFRRLIYAGTIVPLVPYDEGKGPAKGPGKPRS